MKQPVGIRIRFRIEIKTNEKVPIEQLYCITPEQRKVSVARYFRSAGETSFLPANDHDLVLRGLTNTVGVNNPGVRLMIKA